MSDVRETHEPEGDRLTALGCRTDTGVGFVVVANHDSDGSWRVYGPGPAGVRLTSEVMVSWAEAILARCEVPRWAWSPSDAVEHLLVAEGYQSPGAVTARCGHVLAMVSHVRDRPLGPTCPSCRLIFDALSEGETRVSDVPETPHQPGPGLAMADPDDPRFDDCKRDVGDGTGMPRVKVDPPVVVARALLCVIAGLLGLILGILTAVVFAWSIVSGAAVGAAVGAVAAGAIAVTTLRGRAR